MLMRVDLPAPLGPSRPVTPGAMVMVTSLTATTFPNQRETWSIRRVLMGAAHSLRGGGRATGGHSWAQPNSLRDGGREKGGRSSQSGLPVAAHQQAVAAGYDEQRDEEVDESGAGL